MHVWLCQSNYSFLQGASHPHELIDRALSLGVSSLAMTDFDGVYGLVQAYKYLHRLKKERAMAFKLHYGAQLLIHLGDYPDFTLKENAPFQGAGETAVFLQNRIAFLAPSKRAYHEICVLATYAHRVSKKAVPLDPRDPAVPWPQDAIAVVPQRGVSQLFHPQHQELETRWLRALADFRAAFRGPMFLAITPPTSPLERHAFLNHLHASAALNIPLVATGDVFFHCPQRKPLHDTLTSIRLNLPLEETAWACFPNAARTLHNRAYYERFFSLDDIGKKALFASQAIAERMDFCLSELRYQYPAEFIPASHTAQSYLAHLVQRALVARYGEQWPHRMVDLVHKELELVEELGFADYFLTVWDIVRFAREVGILCQGRGSAANSAVCFLLGITAVDPLSSDVLFERFISRERGEPPDIDVDFEHERREEVIHYIYERYGRTRAAMVANTITFRTRGALRSVGKALGFSEEMLTPILGVMRDRQSSGRPFLEILREGWESLKESPAYPKHAHLVARLERWAALAHELRGFPRHLGIHSGGFVISQEPLTQISAIEPATMEGRSVIQWNKEDIEALGLFKIDVLSLGMLTALRKSFSYLAEHRKFIPGTLRPVSLETIPPACQKTFDLACAARTTGVFQIESRAQMSMLPRLRPRCFYDLVIQVAIVRPGPITGGIVHPYLRRRQGLEPADYPDERLRPILERTLGVPIFQEQIMRIAMAVGDFTPGEADELRRAMGAWKFQGTIHAFEEKLRNGMARNGIPQAFADMIYNQIKGFSEYGFPESHAASFANLAYASAYLKAHFPVYFLCGLLNSQPLGFYSPHSLIQEAMLSGVTVHAPCVLRSHWDSEVRRDGSLQLGFRLISSLQKSHVQKFLALREGAERKAPPTSGHPDLPPLEEILADLDVFFSHERISLVMVGALRVYDRNRRNLLWKILAQSSPFFPEDQVLHFHRKSPLLEAWDDMRDDYQEMKTSIDHHPFALIKKLAWPFPVPPSRLTPSCELPRLRQNADILAAGMIVVRQSPPTAKGMVFITLEDEFGTINLVIRPHVYQKYRTIILANGLLCVQGRVQENGTQSVLIAYRFFPQESVLQPKQDQSGKTTLLTKSEGWIEG